MDKIRVAVVGAGAFGKNHLRVLHESPVAELIAVGDPDTARANEAANRYGCRALEVSPNLAGQVDAAIVASSHDNPCRYRVRTAELGIDVLVEKPIAADLDSAQRLIDAAEANGRILQVGHLERFNPAVQAVQRKLTLPLFFEIHRMSMFSPRSLDVDVVLDLMIHDIDVVLASPALEPEEIRAAGIRILSDKVDIANVRLAFPGGCVANLTASRVSTEKVRKIRLFQPHQYLSARLSAAGCDSFTVLPDRQIGFDSFPVVKGEPLQFEIDSFLECVRTRSKPVVTGEDGMKALRGSTLNSC